MRRLIFYLFSTVSFAQLDYVITTIAGSSFVFRGDGGPATEAQLSAAYHVITDPQGNVLVADHSNHQVVRISPGGILNVIAGNGVEGLSGDGGPATRASLSLPLALALDRSGNLFIADSGNNRVRRVSPDGIISTFAGTGRFGNAGDGGSALSATFRSIRGLAADDAGNVYICDEDDNKVRRVAPDGTISRFAGTGAAGFSGDGRPAIEAELRGPYHISWNIRTGLIIVDQDNHRVRRVGADGIINTIAGNGSNIDSGDGGPALRAGLFPRDAQMDAAGNLYITGFPYAVRSVAPDGNIRTLAGIQEFGFSGDGGLARLARLNAPFAAAPDSSGNVHIADSLNLRIRRVTPDGVINTTAGTGQYRFSGDGGPAVAATFSTPQGLAIDLAGNVFISDYDNHRIRRIAPDGTISTFAGTGAAGFSGDGGPATSAQLNSPEALTMDRAGNLYVAELLRVRRITPSGVISTVAGGGSDRPARDGFPATQASLLPSSVASDPSGNLYVLDFGQCVIHRINPGGLMFRYAGQFGQCVTGGDGGPALQATLQNRGSAFSGGLAGMAFDAFDGSLYVAEPAPSEDNTAPRSGRRVRRIDQNGVITTFAGNGIDGYPPDASLATETTLSAPQSIASDGLGRVFIGDHDNIFVVLQGRIFRLIGARGFEFGDGGSGRNATISSPRAVVVDPSTYNLIVLDSLRHRVRALLASPPSFRVPTDPLRFAASSGGAITPPQTLALTASVPGVVYAAIATETWLRYTPPFGPTPRLFEVTADPAGLAPGTYTANLLFATPLASPPVHSIPVTFEVAAAVDARLALDKENFSFTFPRAASPRSQTLQLSNTGGGTLDVTIQASTSSSGGNWLTVSPSSARVLPGRPVTVNVTASPASLAPGTYTGSVTVNTRSIPVTITVSANDRAILLSQTGLAFTAVAGGGVVPPRTFEVINTGRGVVNWTVATSTLSGGNAWLIVNTRSGSSEAASTVPSVEVRVNQTGLAAGVYYGLVTVDAPAAANAPQVLTVFLEVLPAGSDPGPVVEPAELVFTGAAGRSPGSQDVFVYNIAQAAKTYRSTAVLANATLVNLPGDATLDITRANRVIVQPFVAGLPAGVHQGSLNLHFSDGRVRTVRIRVILTAASLAAGRAADGCTPTALIPAITSLAQSAPVTVGWPVPVTAEVRDDCGDPHDTGSVVVSFSNGDTPISLTSLKGGRWSGTWPARAATAQDNTTLKFEAANPARSLNGQETLVVGVRARQEPPVTEPAGVVSAAGTPSYVPLAPGSMISVYGERLAEVTQGATSIPLPVQIGSTRLTMAGRALPLLFVSPGQVNALVPHDLEPNTRHQLLVQRANTYGRPVPLDVGPAQPAVFVAAAPSQGHVYWLRGSAAPSLAAAGNPARAGDVIILYLAGLGATSPVVPAGQPAPSSPLARATGNVRVTIGGIDAPVDFAGLAPGFAGLYQLNARVPAGITAGTAVEVRVIIDDQVSPSVTMAVQ